MTGDLHDSKANPLVRFLKNAFRLWGNLGTEIASTYAHSSCCGFIIMPEINRVAHPALDCHAPKPPADTGEA
ncbi:hypothetical protein O7A70_32840 [Mesorhizobium sp. Cs1299R1N1]|uniref:hypothetical protein n=1 Tax=Mesorhizobium sp. Cs1299R1N1 TaxID=3015172 RepID=UPI00301C99C8